jgi:hypothetical protein
MSIVVEPGQLRLEMARRGMDQAVLARLAGCAPATITHAMHGCRLTEVTVARIAWALNKVQPIPGIDDLLTIEKPN